MTPHQIRYYDTNEGTALDWSHCHDGVQKLMRGIFHLDDAVTGVTITDTRFAQLRKQFKLGQGPFIDGKLPMLRRDMTC